MDDVIKMIYIYAEVNYRGEIKFFKGETEEYSEHLFNGNIENYVKTDGAFGNYFDCQIYLPFDSSEEFIRKIKNDILKEFSRRCFDKIKKYNEIIENLDKMDF
jgi:hypothetical protein